MRGGDEFRSGARTEAGKVRRIVPRREDLQNAEAVLAICDEGEGAGGDHPHLDVVDVVELAFGSEHLFELGRIRSFNVDNGKPLLPG